MKKIVKLVCLVGILIFMTAPVKAATITIAPATPGSPNSSPFGTIDLWTPYMGFIYKNVPAFNLEAGDILAFDLVDTNDVDIQLQIDMAATTTNGGTTEAGSFTTVVTNTHIPENPRGDTTTGNYELRFTVEAPFSFAGGGLIIRFSNPSGAFSSDHVAQFLLVGAGFNDSSENFVQRFTDDTDGVHPWDQSFFASIGGFQVITKDTPPAAIPTLSEWGMIIFALLMVGTTIVFLGKRKDMSA